MKSGRNAADAARLMRWQRLEIAVRCALRPDNPAFLGQFVAAATRLASDGLRDDWAIHERCFHVLLNTAEDAALPLHWRWMCIDHACRPLARLTTLANDDPRLRRLLVAHAGRLSRADLSCLGPMG